MQAVILCGGEGSRLKSITGNTPKPLAAFSDRVFLDYIIDLLLNAKIQDILLLAGFNGHQIEERYQKSGIKNATIKVIVEPKPLGTGGALVNATSSLNETFILINGDTFLDIDYQKLYESIGQYEGMICAYSNQEYGERRFERNNISVTGSRISMYAKQSDDSTLTHVDAGAGVFTKNCLNLAPDQESFSFEENIWPQLIANESMGLFETDSPPYDIGTPERHKIFNEYLEGNPKK